MFPHTKVSQRVNGAILINRKYTSVPAMVENLLSEKYLNKLIILFIKIFFAIFKKLRGNLTLPLCLVNYYSRTDCNRSYATSNYSYYFLCLIRIAEHNTHRSNCNCYNDCRYYRICCSRNCGKDLKYRRNSIGCTCYIYCTDCICCIDYICYYNYT